MPLRDNFGGSGKTPIFFAITRCRNDAVQLLIRHGCNLRIVNNKGQTPLSLAVSHLNAATVEQLKTAEAAQHDRPWRNFRESHSDGLLYGDLDPRFVSSSPEGSELAATQHGSSSDTARQQQ